MEKNNLLTLEEFNYVSTLIIVCARRLVHESFRDIPTTKEYSNPYQDQAKLKTFMKCYKSSVYALNASDSYIQYVHDQVAQKLAKILAFKENRYERIKILAPFVFYSLVVLNEADPIKSKRRMNRVYKAQQDKEKPVNWRQSNPYQLWRSTYRPCDGDEELRKRITKLTKKAYEKNFYSNSFICDAAKIASQEMHNLVDNLNHMRCVSDMTSAGVFLHDILKSEEEEENSYLYIILQMSCVMLFQKVLNVCRLISDENKSILSDGIPFYKDYESIDVVRDYAYEKLGYHLENSEELESKHLFPIRFKEERTDGLIKLFYKDIDKKSFADIYNFLSNNFEYHFPGLVEMYIDKAKVQHCVNTESIFEEYLEVLNELINSSSKVTNCTLNLQSLSKSIKTIVSCRDVLSTQTYISKFETIEKERDFQIQKIQESVEDTAIPLSDYDIPVGLYFDDDFDKNAYYKEKELELQRLKDDLFDLICEFNEHNRDCFNDYEIQQSLRKRIDERVSSLKIAIQTNRFP